MSTKNSRKPVRAAQPKQQEADAVESSVVELPAVNPTIADTPPEILPPEAVLAALDSKKLSPDARRRLGAHLRSLLAEAADEAAAEEPTIRDPKNGAFVYSRADAPKPTQYVKRKKIIESVPKLPFRVVKRQVAEYQTGVLVYAEKQFVQWYNPEAKEFWDLPIVKEEDDYELVEATE